MKLFWCPKTRAVRAVWMLEELGVPYERVLIDIRDVQAKANPAFRAASPMGKVPALEDGATRIWDSGAICAYLADQNPGAHLAPAVGHPDRGRYLQWLMYTNSVIEPAMAEKLSKAPVSTVAHGWGSYELMLDTLRAGLAGGPWILGERFSAADVMLGTACHFLRQFKMLESDPVVFPYVDRCAARPAFQRAMALEVLP
ncbi:MAG: glutathione S-transferase family protein [Proteobacteria bacterium]|nr:glutathione S-transferase family protein [Pseudomonadota bacterium]